jgi:para-nitrobenzyl esterase
MNYMMIMGPNEPTPENFAKVVGALYGDRADDILRLYPATTIEETIASATDLASDRFIAYNTWKWCDLHSKRGGAPVYRYLYAHPRPPMRPEMGDAAPGLAGGVVDGADEGAIVLPPAKGAVHSAEIEYVMGNLATNEVYAWTDDDYRVSKAIQAYFANFIKSGDPNGPGLPDWPTANGQSGVQVMRLDVVSRAEPEQHRERYAFLDQCYAQELRDREGSA